MHTPVPKARPCWLLLLLQECVRRCSCPSNCFMALPKPVLPSPLLGVSGFSPTGMMHSPAFDGNSSLGLQMLMNADSLYSAAHYALLLNLKLSHGDYYRKRPALAPGTMVSVHSTQPRGTPLDGRCVLAHIALEWLMPTGLWRADRCDAQQLLCSWHSLVSHRSHLALGVKKPVCPAVAPCHWPSNFIWWH